MDVHKCTPGAIAKRQLTINVMIQGSSVEDSFSHCKVELPPTLGSLPHTLYAAIPINCMPAHPRKADLGWTLAHPGKPWHSRKVLEWTGQVTSLDVQLS